MKELGYSFAEKYESLAHDISDPDPWLAMYLDRSIKIDDEAKAALLLTISSKSREFFLPLIKPFLWILAHIVTLFRIISPRYFTSSKLLHRMIYVALKHFVTPEANFLILRHFHIGSEILAFVAANSAKDIPLNPLKPESLEAVLDNLFLNHDLNLYNFVINLNKKLKENDEDITRKEKPDYSPITDGQFRIELPPQKWLNFIDVQSAIEIYTPIYQLFLSERDFWRASNSLQLDETVGIYVAKILGDTQYLGLINNKHPLVPLSTLGAGYRLLLHGLAAESLHAILREQKRIAANQIE